MTSYAVVSDSDRVIRTDLIRPRRVDMGMSGRQLADQVGVTRQAVSQWEIGEWYPNPDRLVLIADVLDMPVEEFVPDPDSGPTLWHHRLRAGFTTSEVSDHLEIPHRTYLTYEFGSRRLPPRHISSLAALFAVSPDEVVEAADRAALSR